MVAGCELGPFDSGYEPDVSSYELTYNLGTKQGGDRGSTVVKVLCYKSDGRCFDSRWYQWIFHRHKNLRLHYDPGVDSASNRNEYQEYFLGVKWAGA